MFRAEDLEVIRANLEAPENSYAYDEYKKLVATECDGVIKGELSYNEIGKILTTIESKAFEYALNGDPVVGCPVSARAAYRAGCLRAGGRAGLSQEGAASVLSGSPGGGSALRIGASGFRAGRSSASCRRGAFPVGEWNLRPGPSPFRDGCYVYSY